MIPFGLVILVLGIYRKDLSRETDKEFPIKILITNSNNKGTT